MQEGSISFRGDAKDELDYRKEECSCSHSITATYMHSFHEFRHLHRKDSFYIFIAALYFFHPSFYRLEIDLSGQVERLKMTKTFVIVSP